MLTRQELVLEFMKALCANSVIMEELDRVDQLVEAAGKIADAYLKSLG